LGGGGGGGATRYARNALLLSRASREWRRIAINFLSFFFSRTHRSLSASLSPILSAVHSVPFLLVPFWTDPCLRRTRPCFVHSFVRSSAHSFRMAGVTPCNRNLHPGSHYLHFNSARLSLPLPPLPSLPNGGYKHKYEFKGPQATIYCLTWPASRCSCYA